jgi:hypothetical protein
MSLSLIADKLPRGGLALEEEQYRDQQLLPFQV